MVRRLCSGVMLLVEYLITMVQINYVKLSRFTRTKELNKLIESISLDIINEVGNRKGHKVKVRCLRYIFILRKKLSQFSKKKMLS